MNNVINELLQTHRTDAATVIRALHNKEMRADHLRLLEGDLVEAKHAFTMLACLFLHLGIPFECIKDAVDKVVEIYLRDTFRLAVDERRTDFEKITFFACSLIDEALTYEAVRQFIAEQSPLANCRELDDKQRAWYRLFLLLIPCGMRRVIQKNGMEVYVYGFRLAELSREGVNG